MPYIEYVLRRPSFTLAILALLDLQENKAASERALGPSPRLTIYVHNGDTCTEADIPLTLPALGIRVSLFNTGKARYVTGFCEGCGRSSISRTQHSERVAGQYNQRKASRDARAP